MTRAVTDELRRLVEAPSKRPPEDPELVEMREALKTVQAALERTRKAADAVLLLANKRMREPGNRGYSTHHDAALAVHALVLDTRLTFVGRPVLWFLEDPSKQ